MTAPLPIEVKALNRAVVVADDLRIAVLDPSHLYDRVSKYLLKKTDYIHIFKHQSDMDSFLASEKKGSYHILVILADDTPLVGGMGLGRPHNHLDPVEVTYLNLGKRRLRVARLVNF